MPVDRRYRNRLVTILLGLALTLAGLVTAAPARAADPTPITPGVAFAVHVPFREFQTFSFTGTAGQRVSIATDRGNGSSGYQYQLTGPQGELPRAVLVDRFGDLGVLTSTGTWTLRVWNIVGGTPDLQVTLRLTTDLTGNLTLGTPLNLAFDEPGRLAALTFTGTAGRRIAVRLSPVSLAATVGRRGIDVRRTSPSGSTDETFGTADGATVFSTTLDESGTWKLTLDPLDDTTGSATVTVSEPTDIVSQARLGTPLTVTYPGDGRDVLVRFLAVKGRRFTLGVTASTLGLLPGSTDTPQVLATLVRPDGVEGYLDEVITSTGLVESGLPLTGGTWALRLHPVLGTTGTQTIVLGQVRDTTGTLRPGSSTTVRTTSAGEDALYTMNLTGGRTLAATLSQASFSAGSAGADPASAGVRVTLLRADGSLADSLLTPGSDFGTLTVPETGTYTLRYDPVADTLGRATLGVRYATTTTSPLRLDARTSATFGAGDVLNYAFTPSQARRLVLEISSLSWEALGSRSMKLTLKSPEDGDGETWSQTITGPGYYEAGVIRPQAYTLTFDPADSSTGRIAFRASQPVDVTGTLTPGRTTAVRFTSVGQQAIYTFPWDGTGSLDVSITGSTVPAGTLYLISPLDDGWTGSFGRGSTTQSFAGHGEAGTYSLYVDPTDAATGSLNLTVHPS